MANNVALLLKRPVTVDCLMAKKPGGGRGVFRLPFAEARLWFDPERCGHHMCNHDGACRIEAALS